MMPGHWRGDKGHAAGENTLGAENLARTRFDPRRPLRKRRAVLSVNSTPINGGFPRGLSTRRAAAGFFRPGKKKTCPRGQVVFGIGYLAQAAELVHAPWHEFIRLLTQLEMAGPHPGYVCEQ